MPVVRSAIAFFLFSLAASLAAAAPVTFEEISLSVRMDAGDGSIVQQVSNRRMLSSLTPEQKAALKKEGASDALINTLDDPRFVLSDHEALAWEESRKAIQDAAVAKAAADEAAKRERATQESDRAELARQVRDRAAGDSSISPVSLDVKFGARLDLKRFGGYDMDIVITSADVMSVRTLTIDRTKMVTRTSSAVGAVAFADDSGAYAAAAASTYIDTVPTVTPYEIPLTNGIPVEGAAMQKLFLVYQDDKVAVYYHDTIATAFGTCRLRVLRRPAN